MLPENSTTPASFPQFQEHFEARVSKLRGGSKRGRRLLSRAELGQTSFLLLGVFAWLHRWQLALGVGGVMFYNAATFVSPVMLNRLTGYFQQLPGMPASTETQAYLYCLGLFLGTAVPTFFNGAGLRQLVDLQMTVRAELIAAIYRKATALSTTSRQRVETGRIVNLMSADVAMVQEFINPMLSQIFVSPPIIIACIVLLWFQIRWATFIALGIMLVSLPLTGIMMALLMNYRRKMLKCTDERVMRTNQLMVGIRVLKMYAWEEALGQECLEVRERELGELAKLIPPRVILQAVMFCTPLISMAICFAVYGTAEPGRFTPQHIFTAVAYFNMIRTPLIMLPFALVQGGIALVSLSRLSAFLLLPEREESAKRVDDDVIIVDDATFVWPDVEPIAALKTDKKKVDNDGAADGADGAAGHRDGAKKKDRGKSDGSSDAESDSHERATVGEGASAARRKRATGRADATDPAADPAVAATEAAVSAAVKTVDNETTDGTLSLSLGVGSRRSCSPGRKASAGDSADVGSSPSSSRPRAGGVAALAGPDATSGPASELSSASSSACSKETKRALPTGWLGIMFEMRHVSLRVEPGELVCVVGRVGSGKTSLVQGILGEMERLNGSVTLSKSMAYVPQQAWIVNGTVRDNVMFGLPFDQARWDEAVRCSALGADLLTLPAGDRTEIGERGINLSGGQKQRISLARACYSGAGCYIFDDPLSAVDVHVGQTVFKEMITGLLKDKARLLVTNQIRYTRSADRIVVVDHGAIVASGSFDACLACSPVFAGLVADSERESEAQKDADVGDSSDELDTAVEDALAQSDAIKRSSVANTDGTRTPTSRGASGTSAATAYRRNDAFAQGVLGSSRREDVARCSAPSRLASSEGHEGRLPGQMIRSSLDLASGVADVAAIVSPRAGALLGAEMALATELADSDDDDDDDGEGASRRKAAERGESASQNAASPGGVDASALEHAPLAGSRTVVLALPAGEGGEDGGRTDPEAPAAEGTAGSLVRDVDAAEMDRRMRSQRKLGELVGAEERDSGEISWLSYLRFAKRYGRFGATAILTVWSGEEALNILASWYLSKWTNRAAVQAVYMYYGVPGGGYDRGRYIGGYIGFVVANTLTSCLRQYLNMMGCLRAARNLHSEALRAVVHAPVLFYDVTPMGRILNRFSRDTVEVDFELAISMSMFGVSLFGMLGSVIFVATINPWILCGVAPLLIIYYIIQKLYRRSYMEIQRINAVTRSPIYAHFSETLGGVDTLRAYGAVERLKEDAARRVDHNHRAYWCLQIANEWLSERLDVLGSCFVLLVACLAVKQQHTQNASLWAAALTQSLAITSFLKMGVTAFAQFEAKFNSVIRLMEYGELPSEAPMVIEGARPPEGWPSRGEVVFEDVWMRYRPELEPALRGVSFTVNSGEKLGVVGRTGSGKSSLAVALFRLCEPYRGSIRLDGVELLALGLRDLRQNISIIPQDPVLYSGTVRENLDPYCDPQQDERYWQALRHVSLEAHVRSLEGGLDAAVAEGGENFSVGQRQMLCVARALLRNPRVLVADEATASVDAETDALIQRTIRSQFADVTVITVAHRLNTILDSDAILVMDSGVVREHGSVQQLLADHTSVFHSMAEASRRADRARKGGVDDDA